MFIDRWRLGRATVFALSIGLGGGLAAQSAGPATQQPPTQPTASGGVLVDPVTGKPLSPTAAPARTGYPDGVMINRDATGPAPGAAAGQPTPVRSTGKVGPAGKVIDQNAPSSPDGSAKVIDPAIQRLGPGGAADQTPINQSLGPDGQKSSTPARPDGPQAAKTPDASNGTSQVVNEPVARGGVQVFVDPATGQITQPTDAQLQELAQQNQANVSSGQIEVVERPSLVDGMMVDIPASLLPVVTATIGADGKVILEERPAQAGAKDVISQKPRVGQSSRPGVSQRLDPAGDQSLKSEAAQRLGPDAQQSGRSESAQRLGPGGDQRADLPPPSDVTVTIVNLDGAGEGFNDPTAVAQVFGNPGLTRGAQRLNAFRAAAEYWGGILKSTVPIRVDAQMNSLSCSATSAVLGSAGPTTAHRDFGGAPLAATWYVQATANSRNGTDLAAGNSDISAQFNTDVDNPTCLGATSWWYGIGAPAPAGTIDFYTVVLHEIGHGIGFLSLVSLGTGAKLGGFDDAYERWLWDWTIGGWPAMSDAQRLASAVNTGQVIFWGPGATQAGRGLLTSGLNAGYPRVYAPNPIQGGSSISHFDTVLTPNELMEPAITAPPGPYAFLTSGALEDIGWRLLANGVFDYGGLGTWTWNPTDGWAQPTGANPTNLEPWNGNFVGVYNGTWVWNGTTSSWSQITSAIPTLMKACGANLLWSGAAYGTWRWHASLGWAQLTAANPESLECLGGDAVWESAVGTWLYDFSTGWLQITAANPTGVLPCGSKLAWWRSASDTWYWEATTGWHYLTVGPETTECYRGQLAWESAAYGTWIYNFTTASWVQITGANPEQMLAWGPSLVWENAAYGTWIYDAGGWNQITTANPTLIEVLGAELLWSWPGGTWVWSGAGGGTAWTNITGAVPTEIVSTGQVR